MIELVLVFVFCKYQALQFEIPEKTKGFHELRCFKNLKEKTGIEVPSLNPI